MTSRDLSDRGGTAEVAWRQWPRLIGLGPLTVPVARRVVVVAPHPDDEVLGCGGFLRRLHRLGVAVTVVAVTDGEASHPTSPTMTAARMAERRSAETGVAYRRLGLAGARRVAFHLPDGKVADHHSELARRLSDIVAPGDLWLTPWEADGHPDHDATGRAALDLAAREDVTLLRYLVWTWHWAAPGDPAVPWDRAALVNLGRGDRRAKRRAVAAFASQVRPLSRRPGDAAILDAADLAHHRRPFEVFLR